MSKSEDLHNNQYVDVLHQNLHKEELLEVKLKHLNHFTSVDAIINIVENNTFWASNCSFLNDRREIDRVFKPFMEAIIRVHKEVFDELVEEDFEKFLKGLIEYHKENIFILSFTSNDESIPLWEIYSGSNGLCAKFDYDGFVNIREEVQHSTKGDVSIEFFNVVYDVDYMHNVILDIIEIYKSNLAKMIIKGKESKGKLMSEVTLEFSKLTSAVIQASAITKSPEFMYECEVRAIIINTNIGNVKFRSVGDSIKPYIEIEFKKSPLTEIII